MAHNVIRVLESVYNSPHLVLQSALEPIVDYLQDRSVNGVMFKPIVDDAKEAGKETPFMSDGIGEIKLDGVITYRPVIGLCGPTGTSYQGILEQAYELAEKGAKTIILTHSSPGGQALHCFETARELREMCDEFDIRLISYIDEQSCSASLALGIVADEVIINPSAVTGSVGCVACLYDKSKMLEKIGVKPIYIASTPGKTGMNSDGSFSDELLEQVQEDVSRLGNQFAEHVSEFTGIPVQDILAMNAKVYHAETALEKGLVNSIMTQREFAEYITKGQKNA